MQNAQLSSQNTAIFPPNGKSSTDQPYKAQIKVDGHQFRVSGFGIHRVYYPADIINYFQITEDHLKAAYKGFSPRMLTYRDLDILGEYMIEHDLPLPSPAYSHSLVVLTQTEDGTYTISTSDPGFSQEIYRDPRFHLTEAKVNTASRHYALTAADDQTAVDLLRQMTWVEPVEQYGGKCWIFYLSDRDYITGVKEGHPPKRGPIPL